MFKDKTFNKILLTFISVLVTLIVVLLFLGEKSSPKILSYQISDTTNDLASVSSQINFTFNRVMNKDSVEKGLEINPPILGNIVWIGKKAVFIPKEKMKYDTSYSVNLVNVEDSNGEKVTQEFKFDFKTKPQAVYFISEETNSKGNLKKAIVNHNEIINIISKPVDTYAISPDGKRIVYATNNKVYVKDLENNSDKEIRISNPINDVKYDYLIFQKLLYGNDYIAMQVYPKLTDTPLGNFILLYDLSTTQITVFSPADKIESTDTMVYTPDFKSLIYRDAGQSYAYSNIKQDNPVLLGSFISVSGFDYKQNKLVIVDSDPTQPDYQYVSFIDSQRKKVIVSDQFSFAQDPNFAHNSEQISYSLAKDKYNDFSLFGISIADLDKNNSKLIYFDKNYSAELSNWSPDDQYISFERYSHDLLKDSIKENRVVFNTVKPLYGQITVIKTSDKSIQVLAEKGRDIIWDN